MKYRLESRGEGFVRTLKKFLKSYNKAQRKAVQEVLANIFEEIGNNPNSATSREEPLPQKADRVEGWELRKREFFISSGASGQGRLIYLLNEGEAVVRLIWIYNHEQFEKRPPDSGLVSSISEALEELGRSEND